MKCAKCGLDVAPNTLICPRCGSKNEFANIPKKPIKRVYWIYAALAVIIIVALIVAALAGRGNNNITATSGGLEPNGNILGTSPGNTPNGNIMGAPQASNPSGNIMSAPEGSPLPGNNSLPANTSRKVPQEVLNYLDFVKKVEKHRQQLLRDTSKALVLSASGGETQGLSNLLDMAGDPDGESAKDPLAEVKKELNRQYLNWQNTIVYFDSVPAPEPCRDFSGSYRAVIYSETQAIGSIANGLNTVNINDQNDISKLLEALQKMKADPSIQENIDNNADNADAKLSSLASGYGIAKPFDVPRERPGGNIMGF